MQTKRQYIKLPPYGKPLADLQIKGLMPSNSVYIITGQQGWDLSSKRASLYPCTTLLLPPWLDPFFFRWPVKGCSAIIYDTGYADKQYLRDTAICLFRSGAQSVLAKFHYQKGSYTVYTKEGNSHG